ncbi:MAG: NERD domain-containing protein/DEAD/DEAH box helicase [Ilumatobacter sp.]|nr:NERD domain-containing protein/DEAD/DEAH box helicase [Ilumatobacter sp.]
MARLLPADFDLTLLPHSERRVCQAFVDGLDDTWLVVPHVPILVDHHDFEIDVVLVSPAHGALVVEVKGGVLRVDGGRWYSNDHLLNRSPAEQALKAKYALLRRMDGANVSMKGLFVAHAIAFPDVGVVPPEGYGPDTPSEIVFAKEQLAFPEEAMPRVLRTHRPVPPAQMAAFLQALRPDIELDGSEGRVLQWAHRSLDDETRLHLANLAGLDTNRRVLVQGGAGTGKSMLAVKWARQAVARGERTAVVCFNKPMAGLLAHQLDGTGATVSTFHDVAVQMLEPHGFRVGANPTPEYFRDTIPDALEFHAPKIGTPFDTIVVDEGQDFFPHWFAALERWLDPAGARRLLVVADPGQAIYVDPWVPPTDMVELPMVFNLRNCGAIARLVQRLGGPAPLPSAPYGDAVRHLAAGGQRELRKRVRDAITRWTDDFGLPLSEIAVLTTNRDVRDALFADQPDGCPLVRWEDRCDDAVLCETVHRAKGLERTAVVLADLTGDPDLRLLYIGASRAVASLTLVGPPALGEAVGVSSAGR